MISRLPWRKKLRTSAANNLDKINELIDFINHSDISPVTLSDGATGRIVDAGIASSMKALDVYGESIQDGVPSPDAPVAVQVVEGRNLLNTATSTNGLVNDLGNVIASSGYRCSDYIEVEPSADYYALDVVRGASWYAIVYFDADKTAFDKLSISSTQPVAKSAFTTPENAKYIRVNYLIAYENSVMISKGSEQRLYVPYGNVGIDIDGEITPIPLPSKGFAASLPDGTKDVLTVDSAGRWEWEIVTGKTVFDGTQTIRVGSNNYNGENGTDRYIFITDASTQAVVATRTLCYDDHFSPTNATIWDYPDDNIGKCAQNGTQHHMVFDNQQVGITSEMTANERTLAIKLWLETNPVTVYYKLATPTTEHGYITPPAIPSGAVISIDANLNPEFSVDWWSYQDITDIIIDLKGYVDWKVSQVEGASTVSNPSTSRPVIEMKPLEGLEPVEEIEEREEAAEEMAEEMVEEADEEADEEVAEEAVEEESEGE